MIVESWLARAARRRPQQLAVQDGREALTYAQLYAQALAGASVLAQQGVERGDSVAVALSPGNPFAVALHACWLAGAGVVPIDLRLSVPEREAITAGSALVIDRPLALTERTSPSPAAPAPHDIDLDAVAAVIHTSGTTSQPKRVALTFGNLLWSAQGSAVALGVDPQERWLCTLPVSHIGGLSILARSAIYATTAVVHERFATEHALDALMSQEITLVSVVATTLVRLLDAGLACPPRLRCALAGGGPVPQALLERAAAAGVPVCQTYGLTEACSQVSTVPLDCLPGAGPEGVATMGAGRPLFCVRVQVDRDGEILIAGPTVAPAALAEDGWLHTGDLGSLDADGNLHLVGRKADTIISGGENVAPAEVEAVLEAHPHVAEAAVVGRSDARWGEAVTAFVVLRAGVVLDTELLREHCAQQLAPYKVPKQVLAITGPLPRTRSGKLLRRQLT
jgi:O-succinylbenzoic acid--CoA ligase